MKIFFAILLFFSGSLYAEAHVPVLITQETPFDLTIVEDPELSQGFYGAMNGFPHTYTIVAEKPFHLFTQILAPDIDGGSAIISGVIIKLPESGGRVTEIAALNGKDMQWESEYEPFGGDTYLMGPQFEGDLEPGTYHIQVHTPDNQSPYVLVIGNREEMTLGYFELIKRLMEVKQFFGKSPVRIIESPFVYGPIIFVVVLILSIRRFRARKRMKHDSVHEITVASE